MLGLKTRTKIFTGVVHAAISLSLILLFHGCVEGEKVFDQKSISPAPVTIEQETGVRIGEILADPQRFQQKDVVVFGKALPGLAFEFVGEQPYQVEQGNNILWVITTDIAPAEGSWVSVSGKVVSPYQVKGRRYEVVLIEKTRSE